MGEGFYKRSFTVSTVLHGAILAGALLFAVIQGCLRPRQINIPIDFTVAVNTAEEEPERAVETPERPRDPPPPARLPDEPNRVPDPKETVKKPPEKKPPEKKPPEKKPPEKKPIERGRRVVRGPEKPPVKQTLSDEEIRRWLQQRGIRPGAVDALPADEQSRNFMLVRNAFYEAWNQPPRSEAGLRPAVLEFQLDASGRISAPRLVQSSGSAVFDATVLEAARAVGRVPGLSPRFLRQYPTLSVEFKLQS